MLYCVYELVYCYVVDYLRLLRLNESSYHRRRMRGIWILDAREQPAAGHENFYVRRQKKHRRLERDKQRGGC